MALSVCLACSTAYAVGLARCPHCQSTDHVEQGQPMPKITRHGGVSNAAAPVEEVPSSPGNSSSTSPAKPQPSEKPNETARPRPAPTTGSRSKRTRKGNSGAGSTDGNTRAE